jgi:hypothetical protein
MIRIAYLSLFLLSAGLFIPVNSYSQLERFGGGLVFSSGVDYNFGETGNPGFQGLAYVKLFDRTHLVPRVTGFLPRERGTGFGPKVKTLMFQADVDVQYGLFRENELRFMGFAGVNLTALVSSVEDPLLGTTVEDQSGFNPGLNLGATLEMKVNQNYDAILSGKYIFGNWSQFVVSLGVVYHIYGRQRRGW